MTKQFLKLAFTEFKLFMREPEAVFFTFIFPLFFLFLIMEVFIPEDAPRQVINDILPALIVMIIATIAITGVPQTIVSYRRMKFIKRLKATPVTPFTVLSAWGMANFVVTILGILLLIAAGKLVYEAEFGGEILTFSAGFVLTILSLVSFFLIIAAVSRTERAASSIGMMVYLPVMFFSGVVMPLEQLPDWIARYISPFIPVTHGVELLQGLWLGEPLFNLSKEITVLSGFLIFGAIVAAKTFRWE